MPPTDRPFNVLLSPDHVAMLNQLAAQLQCSKGLVIRDAIRFRFWMVCNSSPTCANGRPCLVPALHAQPTAPPVQTQPAPYPQDSQAPAMEEA